MYTHTVFTLSSPESGFAQAGSRMCLTGGAVDAGAGLVALKAPRSLWTLLCTAQSCRKIKWLLKLLCAVWGVVSSVSHFTHHNAMTLACPFIINRDLLLDSFSQPKAATDLNLHHCILYSFVYYLLGRIHSRLWKCEWSPYLSNQVNTDTGL